MERVTLPSETTHAFLSRVPPLDGLVVVVACIALWVLSRRRLHMAQLRGPPSPSFSYSLWMLLGESCDSAPMYESWAYEYGPAYQVPIVLGRPRIVLYDPKAIAHVQDKQGWTYARTPRAKHFLGQMFGPEFLWADGERHSRQRALLAPAFSTTAIRKWTPIFYDSAHKAKRAWNALIESGGGDNAIVEVQRWMDYISIDTIGLASFSHNFGTLEGNHAVITDIRDALDAFPPMSAPTVNFNLFAQVFPTLVQLPTSRARLMWKLSLALEDVYDVLITQTKQRLGTGAVGDREEMSIIGLLIKAEHAESRSRLSKGEVLSQMKALLVAGFGTVSVTLTWALIELARHHNVQTTLRNELLEHDSDPTYDQLANDLPYLDAVIHETLRIHAPIRETIQQATEDDVIPLSEPAYTKTGQLVEHLTIAKGTFVSIPIASVNRATDFWGEDAAAFKPSRWLHVPEKARQVRGHRHLLTFSRGPRTCLGKQFAITELKAVLTVLVTHFVFELRDGVGTRISEASGESLAWPRVAGEVGGKVPLRVKRYVG